MYSEYMYCTTIENVRMKQGALIRNIENSSVYVFVIKKRIKRIVMFSDNMIRFQFRVIK